MESVYHIVAIRVNETSWAHVWRLHSRYLGTGYDTNAPQNLLRVIFIRIGEARVPFLGSWVRRASDGILSARAQS
jgi:hypothetical protein